MNNLSIRLKAISEFVDDNSSIVDVGCDHGLLSIYLYKNRNNINIICSDVNKNALNNAKKNIKKYGLEENIKTILSDGLSNIDTTNIDTIIISGMGAHTMVGILYSNLKKLKNINNIILQSNNDIDFLRERLVHIGYCIDKESLVLDSGIIYTIIKFKKGFKFYNKKDIYFGPYLRRENSKLFKEKNIKDLDKLKKIYALIPKNHIHHRMVVNKKIRLYKGII